MTEKPVSPAPDELVRAKQTPDIVEVPERLVIVLQGAGSPSDPAFAAAVGALYGVAYGIRFARKAAGLPVFKVGPLIGEWSAEGVDPSDPGVPSPDTWLWEVQIPMPADVTDDEVGRVVEAATTKKGGKLEGSSEARVIRLRKVSSARYARILHKGPYSDEPASFSKVGALLEAEGLDREPWHVEVYLSDPGRTAPENLKTVLLAKVK